jgi:tetratricopeptide (TPR) repeat protein
VHVVMVMNVFKVTDGEIAANNLESANKRSWSKFWHSPERPGSAEEIVAREQIALQFFGDVRVLERLDVLVEQMNRADVCLARAALIEARVASMAHRFRDAEVSLARAERFGAAAEDVRGMLLSILQATGKRLGHVLVCRRRIAADSSRLEDVVPLAALLADLCQFEEADRLYQHALHAYCGVSPFAVAWVYFLLGVLWGELQSQPSLAVAAQWYERAITYVPGYVRARVHLAEIFVADGRFADAEMVLLPAVAAGDAEAHSCLAKLLLVTGRLEESDVHKDAAKRGFDALLEKHELAFADHGAAFYHGLGNDPGRALKLARRNVANRPTIKALEQAHAIAVGAGELQIASDLLTMLTSVEHEFAAAVNYH